MPGFFLTNSIQLLQVSALVNLTHPSLRFGMVDAFKCLEKETKTTKTLYKENLDCVHMLKSAHEPIRFVKNRSQHDLSRIYGCLSIFYYCFDFYGHVHRSWTWITIHGLMDG